ncbi:MAG: serine/threonine-protein kinase [Candidatus Roizmanbacteria bacterium]|nr:serine/threonine-protein kinase [Candidatus Roizmanbacteria bacterium]
MSLDENKYKTIKRLGEGSFGEVFLVRHKHLDREEAAKIIKTNKFYRTLQEAKNIQQLRHKNIIDIYDADILPDKSGIFMTMEYHPIGSVANLKFVSRRQLVEIAIHVLRALEHAHGKEFIHRDIKPNNILLNKHQKAILTDFGLSTKVNDVTKAPQYQYKYHIAPEVVTNKEKENFKTDLYALGVTMHRLINGDPGWLKTMEPDDLNKKIIKGKYPDRTNYRPDISKRLIKVINKALNTNPLKRYQSAKEMLKEIEKKAIFRYDWGKGRNGWHAAINNINIKIEMQKRGDLFDIITSKKKIESGQFRRITEHCFDRIDETAVENVIRKIMSEIDSGFET